MPQRKLRPGKGAKASILTKFVKPAEGVPAPPDGEKNHRSNVVLVKWALDKKAKKIFYYRLDGENAEAEPRYASSRWFSVLEEGGSEDLVFDLEGKGQGLAATEFVETAKAQGTGKEKEDGGFKEPKIKWKNSKARRLLYQDIYNGVVPRHAKDETGKPTIKLEEIWQMHVEEYGKYNRKNFSARVKAIRDEVNGRIKRRDDDYNALQQYIENVGVSTVTFKGLVQWDDSRSKKLVQKDISSGILEKKGYRGMYDRRTTYKKEYPDFLDFKSKVKQFIATQKLAQTMKANDLLGKKKKYIDLDIN